MYLTEKENLWLYTNACMKDHKELNKIVVGILETNKQIGPSARELFREIKNRNPVIVRKGFKSFVKVINTFKEVERTNRTYSKR